ncbi:hypothetical protein FRX31_022571 [Thalictrum thalictroides]|uniref:Uncharacterized protein n=1 Tax=Thalictrum thalictroides TaxID=46969 RepID=A0A7J6VTW7_THATH|nr:hypothetical protein FRX31_022571 [Thalictrum thalictroides]
MTVVVLNLTILMLFLLCLCFSYLVEYLSSGVYIGEELPSNHEDSSANNTINTILTPEPYVAEFSMGEKTVTVEDSAFTDSKVAFIMLSKSILPLDETNVIGMTDGEVRRAYYKALIQTKDLGAEVVGRSETLVAKIKELKTENLHLKDQL